MNQAHSVQVSIKERARHLSLFKKELSDSHLAVCVSSLQDIKLFNSNLLVIDEAFEYLVLKSAKGEKGQYFTPRHVIDMCVLMLNPKQKE